MSEDQGFTVRDRRRIKPDGSAADTKEEHSATVEEERLDTPEQPHAGGTEGAKKPLPPVDFTGFVIGLAQMALMHLGELPELSGGEAAKDLEQARHGIDILDMLAEKTQGNLSEDEERLLRNLRSELKLKYVKLAK